MLGHLGAMLGQLPRVLRLMLAMLTHLDPQERKNGKAKHRKLRGVCRVGARGRGPSLLRGEKAYGSAGHGGLGLLAGFKGLRPTAGQARLRIKEQQ